MWGDFMIIKGALVLDKNFEFIKSDVLVDGAEIKKIAENIDGDDIINADGCYLVPGFIDTHMHGAMNQAFGEISDIEQFKNICGYEAGKGTTTLVPAVSCKPLEELLKHIKSLKNYYKKDIEGSASFDGIHIEGPYISTEYKGAIKQENIRKPDVSEIKQLLEEGEGMVRIMTIAPEVEGAKETIEYLTENGVVASLGHTNATFEEAEKAIGWGAGQCTHLYNAMRPMKHRDPGATGAFLYNDNLKCELIADFFHVDPAVCKITYRAKGKDKINLITDSATATGCPDGVYIYGGRKINVVDGKPRLEDGTISGGTSCLLDQVKNLVSLGVPLEDACLMASKNPAESIGEYERKGSIEEGKVADMLILDKDLNLREVILRGKLLNG